jgi:4-alpha-glucanotransferase
MRVSWVVAESAATASRNHREMTDAELIRRAEAAGISASYLDWRRQRVRVPQRTLAAILDALGVRAGADDAISGSAHLDEHYATAPVLPALPESRSWGFTIGLYSVRSRKSWGHGDLRDLADFAAWSARELGAGFVLVNPLHAAEPAPPLSNSPYLPMTRRYVSPLYLRIEDIAEFSRLSPAQRQEVDKLAAPLLAASQTPELIDRNRVWAAKYRALKLIWSAGRTAEREDSFTDFVRREGSALADWANWCALAELHGADSRRWPAELAEPGRARPATGVRQVAKRAQFHAWLQWLADEQLARAQQVALTAGMPIGLITDLAVGVHPGGADAWAHRDLLVRGMSVGAPPDGFNQRGQDWAQPPWNPHQLVRTGGKPVADLLNASFRHAGGLRVDHVMGLMRLWWIPEGCSPAGGAYVKYDHRMMVGTLAAEAANARALAIGEDLGTVDEWIRRYLSSQHILGTEMAWFARLPDGTPKPPASWRKQVMATVGTHDVPPIAGFAAGDQVTVRAQLGLLLNPEEEKISAELGLAQWRDALAAEHLLPRPGEPSARDLILAMYGHLALTPAQLIGVALTDAVGDRRTQNIPGTSDEYPNWRIPLCDGEGKPMLLEDLPGCELVRDVAAAATAKDADQ